MQILAMSAYYDQSIHEPEDLSEKVETRDALKAPDRDKFIEAIKKEIHSLLHDTKSLIPVTATEYQDRQHWKIGMSLKCK